MKRTQIMLEPEQYEKLVYVSSHAHKSIGNLIRIAIDKVYKGDVRKKTDDIVKKIARMNLPVSSWEDMEQRVGEKYTEGEQI
jgi:hypothetical protein